MFLLTLVEKRGIIVIQLSQTILIHYFNFRRKNDF